MIWNEWDDARLKYYAEHRVIPPQLTHDDETAYKIMSKTSRAKNRMEKAYQKRNLSIGDFFKFNRYANEYRFLATEYKNYVRHLKSNNYLSCNYYWDEDMFYRQYPLI